ncbi:MAG: NosD domain-containing protein [Pyrinomonadaceae bacterium]
MAANGIRVRSKAVGRRPKAIFRPWLLTITAIVFGAASILGYDKYSGRLGIIGPHLVILANGANRIIRVPPGGNVQAAIERANGGDIVELQAGAIYSGTINLPNKPLNDFVTIQSSAISNLPTEKRVSPAQKASMATIVAGILGRPAVSAANGAHHYRFVGIEFTASSSFYNYGLVTLGSGESQVAKLPHDIEIDRSYFRPHKTGVARRGVALNSANTTIKNSYFEGFGYPGEEAQGICGWTGTRNVRILNNYIEGGAENIMFGGADPDSAELIPIDIEVRGNHLNKPEVWKEKVTVKTLFELKNAKRVQFTGNLLTNNWKGSAFRITVRNQDDGAPFSTIEDVVIRDNVIDGSGEGINILGKDDTYPSQTLKRLTIENNLFLNLSGNNGFEGSGYFVQIANGEDITIANNTVFNSGNIATLYGELPRRFIFRDNITGHGDYGIHGRLDLESAEAKEMFYKNVFMNLNRVSPDDYSFPSGNYIVTGIADVGFADPSAKDFRLSAGSRFRGKGRNGIFPSVSD